MEENYKTKKAFGDFAKKIGNPYGLEKNKKAVLDVMIKQKITTTNLPNFREKKLLKSISGITGLGYEAKKAVLEFGKNKSESIKSKIDMNKTYDEIRNK